MNSIRLKMLSSLAIKFSSHFRCVSSLLKPGVLGNQTRCYSDQKIILSEDQPPIPPNLGWIGDENMESVFTMRRIKASFKRGLVAFFLRVNPLFHHFGRKNNFFHNSLCQVFCLFKCFWKDEGNIQKN